MSNTSPRTDESTNEPVWKRWLGGFAGYVVDNLWPLILGVAVGVGLGLFLAWIVWPVEYEEPTITDLDAQTQAYFIAAVAESYVYFGTSQALAVAAQRLTPFGDDLAQALEEALAYYGESGDANSAIFANNIRQLQDDLAAGGFIAAPAVEAAPEEELPATAAGGAAAGGRPWLLIGLGAALLAVAAVLLLRWWRGGQSPVEATWSSRRDEDVAAGTVVTGTPAGDVPPATVPRPPARDFVDAEGYGFADEPEDAIGRAPAVSTVDGGFDEDAWDAEPADEPSADELPPPAPRATAAGVNPPGAATAGAAAQSPVKLGQFTAHCRIGMRDYSEAQNIRSASGQNIGEYGMGVNKKNGILQDNPDQVIALDIWLLDKVDATKLRSQARILLAEYVFDNSMEDAFPRENPDDLEPIIAETGQRFRLQGNKLLLDCQVMEATYVTSGPAKGVFESVQVSMTVFRVP